MQRKSALQKRPSKHFYLLSFLRERMRDPSYLQDVLCKKVSQSLPPSLDSIVILIPFSFSGSSLGIGAIRHVTVNTRADQEKEQKKQKW